ncbi:hypothetical protein D623_10003125 [Myotis brandtii]|uniref:Uncharacterized protein n=1 Tax=Myotis brandtii TaxID=109478 RepID=S7MH07_MYOBR|nr:hypothetical protein D623_10003125 [Myotis brandtii]
MLSANHLPSRGQSSERRGHPTATTKPYQSSPCSPQRRISLQTRKCQQKGKGEQRESRRKWLTRNLKKTYLRKTEKLKTRRVQPQMKQEKKKPSLIRGEIICWLFIFWYNQKIVGY